MIPPRTGVTAGVVKLIDGVAGFTTTEIGAVAANDE